MTIDHPQSGTGETGKLRCVQSIVHSSLWLIVSQNSWNKHEKNKKPTVRDTDCCHCGTAIQDFEYELEDMQFITP
eukprot:4933906-Amphidinium_carterae.1